MEDLFAADILEAGVQVADALGDIHELGLVGGLDLGRTDGQVEGELDAAVGLVSRQPARTSAAAARREADLVLARLGGREGEFARGGSPLRDYLMIVVEDFLYRELVGFSVITHWMIRLIFVLCLRNLALGL